MIKRKVQERILQRMQKKIKIKDKYQNEYYEECKNCNECDDNKYIFMHF